MENQYTNKLINETSPYLLQHAHNPVNWYPWGDEAFEKAKNEDKPVFLSIGYSTCHWCHVMERESFEDTEVAEMLNANFISIKVDREERGDIDSVYMSVCQVLTGSGGWPLTIIMDCNKKPFFAGTYFPKRRAFNHVGLMDILTTVTDKWKTEKSTLLDAGNSISKEISKFNLSSEESDFEITDKPISEAFGALESIFDKHYGGFGQAPKFPSPHNLMFVLQYYLSNINGFENNSALQMVEKTLTSMYQGGIFDHIGYGFSRYSTDEKWLVPHFEKMLYDNALLTILYTEAYEITNNELYRYVAEKTLEYIQREMTDKEGGFYSAEDADSHGEEGKFYTWGYDEIISILGAKDGDFLCKEYGITKSGNFEGKNILNKIQNPEISVPNKKTETLLSKLREVRKTRYPLHKDDKILTSWNALMITAFAKASKVFDNTQYTLIAEKSMEFIETHLTTTDNRLYVSYRNGKTSGLGLLDDYSYLSWAALTLYEATHKPKYLKKALDLVSIMEDDFSDNGNGFFMSSSSSESLIYRPKEFYDGAMPSGNSVATQVISKLATLTDDLQLKELASSQINSFSLLLNRQPTACTFALKALINEVGSSKELICVVNNATEIKNLKLNSNIFSVHLITPENKDELIAIVPHLKEYTTGKSFPVFYLCENKSCSAPIYDIVELSKHIKNN